MSEPAQGFVEHCLRNLPPPIHAVRNGGKPVSNGQRASLKQRFGALAYWGRVLPLPRARDGVRSRQRQATPALRALVVQV